MHRFSLLSIVHDNLRAVTRSVTLLDVAAVVVAAWALLASLRAARPRTFKATKLRGPPRTNFVFGAAKQILETQDPGDIYEAWAKEYGVVYQVPTTLGGKQVVLTDPRALAHYYARETWTYVQTDTTKLFTERNFGRGMLWAEGDEHKRQRKLLAPALGHAAMRNLTPIFYNCAHKAKSAWEAMIDASGGDSSVIDVQKWMNRVSLDCLGLAEFSYDFGSLEGKPASITEVLDTFDSFPKRSTVTICLMLLSRVFTLLSYAPRHTSRLFHEMQSITEDISTELFVRTKKEKAEGVLDGKEDKSIIGVLVKANDSDSLTREEVVAQMKGLLFAGYETMSVSMTWALLELARNPDMQNKLRQELLAFGEEPTYDQLQHSLPYLDAVVHETLRVHPPVTDRLRMAAEDDVIPLSEPVVTQSGEVVNSVSVTRGTRIVLPISCVNRSTEIWGADAKAFRPERWLEEDGISKKAQEIQAYRHILSFTDGAKTCIGKYFAIAEFKVVMSVLVKNFVLEMRDGSDTQVELAMGMIMPKPRIVGEQKTEVPLRIRLYEG
ncbi:cytochrome P450 [Pisolithus marmoratus]|nr:cytochrome P450 [Pisolithus marmoratus]